MPHFGDKIHSTLILNPCLVLILGNMASIIPRMLLALNQSIELILDIQSRVIPLSHQILNYNNAKLCYCNSGIAHRSKLIHSAMYVFIFFSVQTFLFGILGYAQFLVFSVENSTSVYCHLSKQKQGPPTKHKKKNHQSFLSN